MKQSIIAIAIACLLIGAAGGYGTGYVTYEPKIRSYKIQVSDLTSEVSRFSQVSSSQEAQISNQEEQILALESEVSRLSQVVSSQEAQISSQEAQILALESEKSKLQSDLAKAQKTIMSYKEQVTTLKSQISSLQDKVNRILGITVPQYYEWDYQWKTWQWNLRIPLSIYVEYLERTRPTLGASYVNMAKDPEDDLYIDAMVQQINSASVEEGFTEFKKLNFVIAFIQSLPYTVDIETKPYDEYPRYPIETLFDRGGDCEDTSILVAAILDRMGYDVALLLLKNAKHMAVGVSIPGSYGLYYGYDDKKYFYLETTGEGWEIGQIPPGITDTTAYIYPLRG